MYKPHALHTVSPAGDRRQSGVWVVLQLLRSVSVFSVDLVSTVLERPVTGGKHTAKFQTTYLQTCPATGALDVS